MTTALKAAKAQRHYSEHPVGTQRTSRYGTELLPSPCRIINTLNYSIMTDNQQEKRPQLNCKITARYNGEDIELNLRGVTAITAYMDRDLFGAFLRGFIASWDRVDDRIILLGYFAEVQYDYVKFIELIQRYDRYNDRDFSTAFFEALMQEITYQLNC